MSLRQRLRLELDDGEEIEATYDGRDLRAWESKYNKSSLVGPMSLSQLTFLGWSAARREGSINGKFERYESFEAVCVDVRGIREEGAEPDPPRPSDTPSDPSAD